MSHRRIALVTSLFVGLVAGTVALSALAGPNIKASQLYQQGVEANVQGKPLAAIELFEQAAQADAQYPDTFFNLGVLQYKLGNYPKAQAAFTRVTQLSPSDVDGWYNLGLAQEKLQQQGPAIASFQRVPMGSPRYASAQGKIATLQQAQYQANLAKQQLPATTVAATPSYAANSPITQPATNTAANTTTTTPGKPEIVAKEFSGPTGIAIGADGTLFVANYSKNVIDRIAPNGQKSQIDGGGNLNGPVGLVYHPVTQELFVANYLGNTITRIAPNGQAMTLAKDLKKPYYLNIDVARNSLYVSEQETNTVSRIRL